MCPPLTCLQTRDTGGVKHPLPLSRTQWNLVCQQVYLTQRPTQQMDKTVEQRQLNVSVQESKLMHLCLYCIMAYKQPLLRPMCVYATCTASGLRYIYKKKKKKKEFEVIGAVSDFTPIHFFVKFSSWSATCSFSTKKHSLYTALAL